MTMLPRIIQTPAMLSPHALALADRAYVLETGRVVLEGPGKELLVDEKVGIGDPSLWWEPNDSAGLDGATLAAGAELELLPRLEEFAAGAAVVCYVLGAHADQQGLDRQRAKLAEAGAIVTESAAQAARTAAAIALRSGQPAAVRP